MAMRHPTATPDRQARFALAIIVVVTLIVFAWLVASLVRDAGLV